MTPEFWVDAVANAAKAVYWEPIYSLTHQINQSFVTVGDDRGLERFHASALRLCADPENYRAIRVKDFTTFERGVETALREGFSRARGDGGIKALYFEYFYDGGEWCNGNLYLCRRHPNETNDWACEFGKSDIIEGPNVAQYLNYDPDLDFEPTLDCIAHQYVDAMFLASCIRAWRSVDMNKLPFGFAQHDSQIININVAS